MLWFSQIKNIYIYYELKVHPKNKKPWFRSLHKLKLLLSWQFILWYSIIMPSLIVNGYYIRMYFVLLSTHGRWLIYIIILIFYFSILNFKNPLWKCWWAASLNPIIPCMKNILWNAKLIIYTFGCVYISPIFFAFFK